MAEKLKNKVTDGFQKGHPYGELPPCIHVGILNFNQMISPNYYHKFCLMDEKTKEIYSRKFQFHMLELKKLKYAKEKQQRKPLYQWAKLIAAQTWEELEQESKGNKYMERALEEMIKISQDEMERYLYLREEMAESDRVSQIQSAKRIGRKEGEILKLISLVQKKILKNIIITAVMIVLIAIIAIILVKVNSSNVKNKEVKGIKPGTEAVKTKADTQTEDDSTTDKSGIEEFALFGVDSRSDQLDKGTRSDSIMVVRVDHDAKKIRMVSIFRDCMMNIDGHGYQKVTHAHAFGGPELAVDTLNKNLDLDIKNYVTVNFNTVGEIVDEVGGIVQDIDASEAKVINGYIDEVNKVRGTSSSHIDSAGTYTLDGTQAVAYARIRYTAGGDYKRAERQRTVLFKVFESAKQMNTAAKIKMVSDLIGHVNTNYNTDEILSVFKNLADYTVEDSTAYPQVFSGGKVDGAWVEVPTTLADMATGVHQFLEGDTGYTPSATVNEYSSALSGKVSGPNNDLTNTNFGD